MPIRSSRAVRQAFDAAILAASEDLVAVLREISNKEPGALLGRHSEAVRQNVVPHPVELHPQCESVPRRVRTGARIESAACIVDFEQPRRAPPGERSESV